MTVTLDAITLGVIDLGAARKFCQDGLGGVVSDERDGCISVVLGPKTSMLVLTAWDALADQVHMPSRTSGFRAFTLSCIVDSASAVDATLARLVQCGGVISKPPRNAMWGYSAYVTDPNGYLWKIASSKRKPFLGGDRPIVGGVDLAAMRASRDITVTIGVADMNRAKQFYRDAFELPVVKNYRKFVSFSGGDGSSDLAMYHLDALADDADVPATGSGFRGLAFAHRAQTTRQVEAVVEAAARADGKIIQPMMSVAPNRSVAVVADPDGHFWTVTSGSAISSNAPGR